MLPEPSSSSSCSMSGTRRRSTMAHPISWDHQMGQAESLSIFVTFGPSDHHFVPQSTSIVWAMAVICEICGSLIKGGATATSSHALMLGCTKVTTTRGPPKKHTLESLEHVLDKESVAILQTAMQKNETRDVTRAWSECLLAAINLSPSICHTGPVRCAESWAHLFKASISHGTINFSGFMIWFYQHSPWSMPSMVRNPIQ